MKQPVRAFSIGLFTAGIILLAILLFFDEPQKKTNNLSHQEMVDSLEKDGFQVLSEEEYITLSVKNEKPEKKKQDETKTEEKEQPNETKAEDNQEKMVKKYTLKIEPGLASSSSISATLEKNGIIDDASKFNDYLEDNDYSKYVQIGTFELTSDMTFNEVAETITN